jgi:hypothetical protein
MSLRAILFLLLFSIALGSYAGEPRSLMDQIVTVDRGDFKHFHFRIPDDEGTDPMRIRGSFKTSGGLNDDITFRSFTQENYVKWFSHYKHEELIALVKRKEGTFEFAVTPGETYYFVLDNFFSSVSKKKVQLKIELIGS